MKANYLLFLFAFIGIMLLACQIISASDTEYERYTTTSALAYQIYGTTWYAQSFTIGTTGSNVNQTLTSLKLYCYVVNAGGSGKIGLHIRVCSAGKPTGNDIYSCMVPYASLPQGSVAWYEFLTSGGCVFRQQGRYCFLINYTLGDASHKFMLYYKNTADAYPQDIASTSANSGSTWTLDANRYCCIFDMFGLPYTAPQSTLFFTENLGSHITGTHETKNIPANNTIHVWNNYTGWSSDLTLYDNAVSNPVYDLFSSAYSTSTGWKVWMNQTSSLIDSSNIINATGTHQHRWNSTTKTWVSWANYTGTLTPLHIRNTTSYLSKSFIYKQNNTGWWCYDNDTGASLISRQNIINATGTHQNRYNSTTNKWVSWANYTGTLTPIHLLDSKTNCTGTLTDIQNNTGYWITSNHIGTTTPIELLENIIGATGTHNYLLNSGGYHIFANYTGTYTTPVLFHYNNTHNVTGTIETSVIDSNVYIWNNQTGVTTPINLFENIGYAFGTHEYSLDSYGYRVYANYSSSLSTEQHIINATGSNDVSWDGISSWLTWANYTGDLTPLHHFENIYSATGTHTIKQNNTGYWIYANYSGSCGGCPDELKLYLNSNIINATGTHEYRKNSTGFIVWANYTGNIITCPPVLKLYLFSHIINATGFLNSSTNSTGFIVNANYTGYGNSSFDPNLTGVWVYLGAMLSIDNTQFDFVILLIYFFIILSFIYSNKTNQMFINTKGHYIFIMCNIVLLLGIEVGGFIGYAITDPL
jgi:hypothetical protein